MTTNCNEECYTFQKIQKIFELELNRKTLSNAEERGDIPPATRTAGGHRQWALSDLPAIGEAFGFLKPPKSPKVVTVYSKKGGVFKTSIALNLARMAALHNIKVLVIGLDDQADITSALGFDVGVNDNMSIEEAEEILDSEYSLADLIEDEDVSVNELICHTDLPSLDYIPELPQLDFLEHELHRKNLRDFWLIENVIKPLRDKYQLFVLDLGPAWNLLTVNALMAADAVVSPVECKINHYRNMKYFKMKMANFKKDIKRNFKHIYVPVKVNDAKKLTRDIRKRYMVSLEEDCVSTGIRTSSQGEDAMVKRKSVIEFAPSSLIASEMRQVLKEVWHEILETEDYNVSKVGNIKSKENTL